MIVLEPQRLKAATGGRWQLRPSALARPLGVAIDTRQELRGRVFVALRGARHDGHDFVAAAAAGGAALAVVDRDITLGELPEGFGVLRVDDARAALAALAREHRRTLVGTKVIAVTGSAGKTTTKQLIHAVLARRLRGSAAPRSFNNDIGVPLTLLAAQTGDAYVVVEIGTNAPGEIGRLASLAEPDVAVITTIGRAHLEGLGSPEAIVAEKASLLAHLAAGGLAVVNADVEALHPYLRALPSVVRFGTAASADLRMTNRGRAGGAWWVEVNARMKYALALPGAHNALNALAAIAIGRRFGLDDLTISGALASIEPTPMRMALQRAGEIDVYNDAYNANPESMVAALETFGELTRSVRPRVVVLGDMLELGPAAPRLHVELGRTVAALHARRKLHRLVLVGPLAALVAGGLGAALEDDRVVTVPCLDEPGLTRVLAALDGARAVLLKGSRGGALERVAEALRARTLPPAPEPANT